MFSGMLSEILKQKSVNGQFAKASQEKKNITGQQ
jgi:hypothetical protein